MQNVVRKQSTINALPLWQAAREREFRELPYPAKRLARQIGYEPELARLVAELAGLKGGWS